MSTLSPELSSKTIKINPDLDQREEVVSYFIKTYELYEKLFDLIKDHKAYYIKS